MYWSWWNKHLNHDESIDLNEDAVYAKLLEYYRNAITNGSLIENIEKKEIFYSRGSTIFSACGIGTELWLKHYVKVNIKEITRDLTEIYWDINMKLFGLQAGKNAIIEECKKIVRQIV